MKWTNRGAAFSGFSGFSKPGPFGRNTLQHGVEFHWTSPRQCLEKVSPKTIWRWPLKTLDALHIKNFGKLDRFNSATWLQAILPRTLNIPDVPSLQASVEVSVLFSPDSMLIIFNLYLHLGPSLVQFHHYHFDKLTFGCDIMGWSPTLPSLPPLHSASTSPPASTARPSATA